MPVFKRNPKSLDDKIRGLVEIDADTRFMGMEAKEGEFELHVEQNRLMHREIDSEKQELSTGSTCI